MLSELARVFSSQGVLVQGTQYAQASKRNKTDLPTPNVEIQGQAKGSQFDQASSKLELSKSALEQMAKYAR